MSTFHTPPDASNVVALPQSGSHRFSSPLRQIEGYWSALRKGSDVPFRSAIDPRGLENVLQHAFILERIAPGLARFRIAGTHIASLVGMEVRGMPMTCLFSASGRMQFSAALEHCFDAPAVVHLKAKAKTGLGRPALSGDILMLPLKSDIGQVNRVLGGMITHGAIGNGGRRFDISDVSFKSLRDEAVSMPEYRQDAAGLAEDQVPFSAAAPYLRLVKNDS